MSAVKVATFNIRNGLAFDWLHSWPFRRRATLAAIADLDADVVGLQEAYGFQLRWLTARLRDTHAVGEGRSPKRQGEHTPILVRGATLDLAGSTTRWFGETADTPGTRLVGARFPRIATTARVRLAEGTELSVTNTHLDERSKSRRLESVSQLLGWLAVDRCPQVVLGDFNSTATSAVIARFAEAGFTRIDSGLGGTVHSFTGRNDGRALDHILVRGPIDVIAAGVSYTRPSGALASDHWPVWAELDVRA
ncbi:MAG: endonuclease/exonuclease/phosphatase family protein [Actinobacteria bacterium]|nr:endonuclease/exonuclease/phosphatase family protein [Actinomycetota bacterium]